MKGSTDQNSYTGMIRINDPIFMAEYAAELWSILDLDFSRLCQFIIDDTYQLEELQSWNPLTVISKLETLNKQKKLVPTGEIEAAHKRLSAHFAGTGYLDSANSIKPIMFYCSALYLQLERLQARFDMSNAVTKSGGLSGVSKRGFTPKDFMARYTTGDKKLIWGNPYMKKERVKGEGEITSILTKASGFLTIKIKVDRERAREIQGLIESAGVSSFYLGKKGLAYVASIRI